MSKNGVKMMHDQSGEQIVRVRRGRWWGSVAGSAAGATIFLSALLGVPEGLFGAPSVWMALLQWFSWVGLPLCLVGLGYMLRGALFPEHLRITEQGLSTRGWQVQWEEILRVGVEGSPEGVDGQVVLQVTTAAHQREKSGNRWASGRPFGVGGLPAKRPTLRTQRAMELTPDRLAGLIEDNRRRRLTRSGLH